jgi:hypothetical protein
VLYARKKKLAVIGTKISFKFRGSDAGLRLISRKRPMKSCSRNMIRNFVRSMKRSPSDLLDVAQPTERNWMAHASRQAGNSYTSDRMYRSTNPAAATTLRERNVSIAGDSAPDGRRPRGDPRHAR